MSLPDLFLLKDKKHKNDIEPGKQQGRLFGKNTPAITPVIATHNSIRIAQNFYKFERGLSSDHYDEAMRCFHRDSKRSRRTNLAQRRNATTGVYMTRVQEVQPLDRALTTKLKSEQNSDNNDTDTARKSLHPNDANQLHNSTTPSASSMQSQGTRGLKSATSSMMLQLPPITYKMCRSSFNSDSISIPMRSMTMAVPKDGLHKMSRRPLRMPPMVSSLQMNAVKKHGRNYIVISGPPAELGMDRAGWFRKAAGTSISKYHRVKNCVPPLMSYIKEEYLEQQMDADYIKALREAWLAWETASITSHHIPFLKTLRESAEAKKRQQHIRTEKSVDDKQTGDEDEAARELMRKQIAFRYFKKWKIKTAKPPTGATQDMSLERKQKSVMKTIMRVATERYRRQSDLSEQEIQNALDGKDNVLLESLHKYVAHDVSSIIGALEEHPNYPNASVGMDEIETTSQASLKSED